MAHDTLDPLRRWQRELWNREGHSVPGSGLSGVVASFTSCELTLYKIELTEGWTVKVKQARMSPSGDAELVIQETDYPF